MVKALSVKQFNQYFKTNIKHDPILTRIYIRGSLANIRYNNNHLYFSLKEDSDVIDCVIYYYDDKDIDLSFFKEGIDTLIRGNLSYNNYSSRVVVVASEVKEVGLSEEYARFLRMKEDFKNRGYFDMENKKSIKTFPKSIGLVTSKDGAAIVDFLSVINQKPNDISIKLAPVKVQGSQSSSLIVDALNRLDKLELDAIVITRGGGSNEALSAFNDGDIIETVFKARTPIISAIGHKIDTTLLDLVADLSLQTPTEAGSYIIKNYSDLEKDTEKILASMKDIVLSQIRVRELSLDANFRSIKAYSPKSLLDNREDDLDKLKKSLDKALVNSYKQKELSLNFIEKRLALVLSLIESRKQNIRIKDVDGKDIFSKHSLKAGDQIQISFSDGEIRAVISDR